MYYLVASYDQDIRTLAPNALQYGIYGEDRCGGPVQWASVEDLPSPEALTNCLWIVPYYNQPYVYLVSFYAEVKDTPLYFKLRELKNEVHKVNDVPEFVVIRWEPWNYNDDEDWDYLGGTIEVIPVLAAGAVVPAA